MEELQRENEQLKAQVKDLSERLQAAEAMIKKLTELLGQNSRNSSWPSSRDKSRKPKPKSQRKKSGRKAGGQKGHQGHTLQMQPEPDEVHVSRPEVCEHCQCDFDKDAEAEEVSKRQVLELPPLRFITTEYQVEKVRCPNCEQVTAGRFPDDVTQPVQYGRQVKQLAVYLKTEQFIPYKRSQQFVADLFELPTSVGSLQNFVAAAAERVEPATEQIKEAIIESEVLHVDETGFYIGGKRHWLHTASTQTLSYYAPHLRRGKIAPNEIGILPNFKGVMVHDFWQSYNSYDQATHALCNAHHLRDLTAVHENDGQLWALLMIRCLLAAKSLVDQAREAGNSALPPEQLQRLDRLYTSIVAIGFTENPLPDIPPPKKRGRLKKGKARNLLERFDQRKADILRFAFDFKVPFDNNLAERDIRMMKVQQKISGCFRSEQGAKQFCLLRSYTDSIRKQGRRVWDAIGSLFSDVVISPLPTPPV